MIGPTAVFNMRANPYNQYGIWSYLQSAYNWATGAEDETGPPSYETVTAPDTEKIVDSVKVQDGAYTWIVYSNGDLKIFNVPAGKESLIGTRYRIGDTNYAKTLGVLRSRSKQVDKVLAKNGLDGAKLSAGSTAADAAIVQKSAKRTATGDDATRIGGNGNGGGGGLQLRAGGIAGIAMGVIGLALILTLVFRKKKKKS